MQLSQIIFSISSSVTPGQTSSGQFSRITSGISSSITPVPKHNIGEQANPERE
jgi:hypothetical protein